MIPYFQLPALHLGPLEIQSFGVFAALGVYVASRLIGRAARQRGLDGRPLTDFATWGVVAGVVCAHLVHLLLYHPEELRTGGPLQILKVWDGLSSMGGLLGGVLAAVVFFHRRGLRFSEYADSFALGIAPGWAIARLGCFSVHDHPGVLTSFFFAVRFPDGPRHDLGLYDALVLFALTLVLYRLARRRLLTGRLLAVLALGYGAARFALDFLRARDVAYADARYLGLTPAQYASVLLVVYGVVELVRQRSGRSAMSNSSPEANRGRQAQSASDANPS